MEQKTSQSAVVDDVRLCFWVCVSDRGNIVVQSGGGTLVQSTESSAAFRLSVITYACMCGGLPRWSEFKVSLITGSTAHT